MATNQRLRMIALYLGLLALVACERAPVPQPPGILSPTPSSTIAATEASTSTPTAEITTPTATAVAETATPLSTPTSLPPTATATLSPTAVPDSPTAEPSPSSTVTVAATQPPTATATLSPTSSPPVQSVTPESLAPGQRNTATLAPGEFNVYTFDVAALQPVLIFVETDGRLDMAVAVYAATVTAATDLAALTSLAQADANVGGGPEILTFVPNAAGAYSLVLRAGEATGDEAGQYTLYLFDMETTTADVAVRETATLATGQVNTYTVQSNGSRPLLLWLNPAGQADLIGRVIDESGDVIVEGNFAGPGAVESVYVLPRQTTTYTIQVLEAGSAAATYNVMIVTLD